MDNQTFFDAAVTAVIKQGKRSANEGGRCLYRGPNGLKCAIGQMIPDDVYDPLWDEGKGKSAAYLKNTGAVPLLTDVDLHLLNDLQQAHDFCDDPATFVEDFTYEVEAIARKYRLTMPEV